MRRCAAPHAAAAMCRRGAVQHLHRGLESDVLPAPEQGRARHPDVVEDNVVGRRPVVSHFPVEPAGADTWRVRLDDERGHAGRTLLVRIRARHHREDAGVRGVGDVALGAVDDVGIAFACRARAQRRGIGSGFGLGKGQRTDQLAGGHPRQILPLLLLRAVDDDPLRADPDRARERRAIGCVRPADLEDHPRLVLHPEPHACVVRRNRKAEEALLLHLPKDAGRNGLALLDGALVWNQALVDEPADRVQQRIEHFGIERHGVTIERETARHYDDTTVWPLSLAIGSSSKPALVRTPLEPLQSRRE